MCENISMKLDYLFQSCSARRTPKCLFLAFDDFPARAAQQVAGDEQSRCTEGGEEIGDSETKQAACEKFRRKLQKQDTNWL